MSRLSKLELKIPPPVYFLLFAAGMWYLARYVPLVYLLQAPFTYTGLVLILCTFLLDLSSLWAFLQAHTTVNPLRPSHTHTLVTHGLYRYTRNPMYLGLLLMLIGWGLFLGALSPFLILPAFVWVITRLQILPEERILQAKFGITYRDYRARVPRWL